MNAEDKRSARLSFHIREQGARWIRALARFHKKSVAQYLRDAIGEYVGNDLHLLSAAMRIKGYDDKKIEREMKKMLGEAK